MRFNTFLLWLGWCTGLHSSRERDRFVVRLQRRVKVTSPRRLVSLAETFQPFIKLHIHLIEEQGVGHQDAVVGRALDKHLEASR